VPSRYLRWRCIGRLIDEQNMIFKHEITWDGITIILALATGLIFIVKLQDKADASFNAAQLVSAHQNVQDDHLNKLDTSIQLLTEIVAERTGKPIPNSIIRNNGG
jgi:hypothetical protein